ncbi:DMT family transporter [Chryseobacterium indologenes]|uniref:DMT family transporter n=1 Tax=Chryseobacterium indologenes TaxID=253 RepID=UPI0003E07457|nr:DMT family transporter [Chryseobacterium indologenes]QPQ51363.1 DMT family transporter [Chryseobacterium indologenes]GAE65329.1 hypothetical protein CIN01S_10_03480 [Chryseobacterium indologenes NBRC 14944]SFI91981.1 EamA-like transporter family protein [Chryseobacterium indologenes]SUX49781.1 EamA-like transporter family [Chryseobacterium indologenes]
MRESTRAGILWMAISTLLYVLQEAILKNLTLSIDIFNIVLFRNIFGLLFFLPLLIQGRFKGLRIVNKKMILLRAIFGFGAMASYIYALKNGAFLMIGSISLLVPLITAFLVPILLKENIPSRLKVVFILSLIAAIFITFGKQHLKQSFNLGIIFVFISMFYNAGIFIIIKLLTKSESNFTISVWMSITQIMFSLPFSFISLEWPQGLNIMWLAIAGILAALGQITMAQALRVSDTTTMVSSSFLRFVWVFLLSIFFFNETPNLFEIIGALILVSVNIMAMYNNK